MKCKTLLLGTAAVFAVAGSARAADLAVAESVEYVKVCDAYGAGYFYIPGSDTCLKIGGDLQFETFFQSPKFDSRADIVNGDDSDMSWFMRTRAEVNITAKSKGKGFQGVVKRHGFHGVGSNSHGQHDRNRAPGSIGNSSDASRVMKGMRMGGRDGGKTVKVRNVSVLKIFPETEMLFVKCH